MLFCETTGASRGDIEDLAIFASQLAALGVPARVDVTSVPDDNLGHSLQFDLAPRLADGGLREGDRLVLLAADQLTDAALVRLRRFGNGVELTARAFGISPAAGPRSACVRGFPISSAASLNSPTSRRPIRSAGARLRHSACRAAGRPLAGG